MTKKQIAAIAEARLKFHFAKLYHRDEYLAGDESAVQKIYLKVEKKVVELLNHPCGFANIMQACDELELMFLQPRDTVPAVRSGVQKLFKLAAGGNLTRKQVDNYPGVEQILDVLNNTKPKI